jgi:glutathione S-transferase
MTALLVCLPFSPWSLRARWALDHHGIAYKKMTHLPMVGEPLLRGLNAFYGRSPSKLFAKASVPMLIDRGKLFSDSLTIAEHAEETGSGSKLLPEAHKAEILGWVDAADQLLGAGRGRLMDRLIASDAALSEMLPPPLRPLGGVGIATARISSRYVKQKYLDPDRTAAQLEAAMDAVLERVEKRLETSPYLTGAFSFADVAVAGALDMIDPRPAVWVT